MAKVLRLQLPPPVCGFLTDGREKRARRGFLFFLDFGVVGVVGVVGVATDSGRLPGSGCSTLRSTLIICVGPIVAFGHKRVRIGYQRARFPLAMVVLYLVWYHPTVKDLEIANIGTRCLVFEEELVLLLQSLLLINAFRASRTFSSSIPRQPTFFIFVWRRSRASPKVGRGKQIGLLPLKETQLVFQRRYC